MHAKQGIHKHARAFQHGLATQNFRVFLNQRVDAFYLLGANAPKPMSKFLNSTSQSITLGWKLSAINASESERARMRWDIWPITERHATTHATRTVKLPSPATAPTMMSPATTAATPSGVPV